MHRESIVGSPPSRQRSIATVAPKFHRRMRRRLRNPIARRARPNSRILYATPYEPRRESNHSSADMGLLYRDFSRRHLGEPIGSQRPQLPCSRCPRVTIVRVCRHFWLSNNVATGRSSRHIDRARQLAEFGGERSSPLSESNYCVAERPPSITVNRGLEQGSSK